MHIPVLLDEVVKYLDPKSDENLIDATIGKGGHTLLILEKNGPKGKVLGIDLDPKQIENCELKLENFKNRVILVRDNFANLKEIVQRTKFYPVHGILFDLGFSSDQMEADERGFSFRKNEPLDMRYYSGNPINAEKILNYGNRHEIERILKEYGQERFAKVIAREIVQERTSHPIHTVFQLVHLINDVTPRWYQHKKIHPATKTFQALRIAVNNELENLTSALPQAVEILEPEGRLVVISFHSLEDRIVKNFLKHERMLRVLTKKPIIASSQERKSNPKSRSAKLRSAIKIT